MKKFILILSSLFVLGSLSFASPAAINWDNISEDRISRNQLSEFIDYYEIIRYPVNSSEVFLDEVLSKAEELNNTIKKLKKPNYDESLLQFIVLRCLYNFDRVTFNDVEKFYKALDKKYKNRAEHHWIYGNFLGTTFSNLKAIDEMYTYLEMVDYSVNPFFMSDLAYISLLSGCPLSALDEITIGGQVPAESLYPDLYKAIQGQIKTSDPKKSYSAEEIWKMGCRLSEPEDLRFFSTMLGVSLPLKEDWGINAMGYSDDVAIVLLTPPAFKVKKDNITIQILITLTRKNSKKKNRIDPFANLKNPVLLDEKQEVRSLTFDVYKDEDPEVYNDDVRKGAVRYVYIGTTDHQDNNGMSVEYPLDMERIYKKSANNENGINKYFSQKPAYLRFNEEFDVVILVDSCKAVEKQTEELMKDFMTHVVFE